MVELGGCVINQSQSEVKYLNLRVFAPLIISIKLSAAFVRSNTIQYMSSSHTRGKVCRIGP